MEKLQTELEKFKEKIEKQLADYFCGKELFAKEYSANSLEMIKMIKEITLRKAKRIRAALLFYSFLANGGEDANKAIYASMAMELAQTFLLIHDDIIDEDPVRRGGPTIHKMYEKVASIKYNYKKSESYGKSMAILAGDMANSMSAEILANSGFSSKKINKALMELNQMYALEYFGEALDVASPLKRNITQKEIIQIHQLKTVPYTFLSPIRIGAFLARGNGKNISLMDQYSTALGTAFQIQDDILGMFGEESKIGKSTSSDLREGKKTLLILDALEKSTKKERQLIVKNLGNDAVTDKDLEDVRKIIVKTKALEKSQMMANKYADLAVSCVEKTSFKEEYKDFFIAIANYVIKRQN